MTRAQHVKECNICKRRIAEANDYRIPAKLRSKWANALERGNYVQVKGRLRDKKDRYDALGILIDITDIKIPVREAQSSGKIKRVYQGRWWGQNDAGDYVCNGMLPDCRFPTGEFCDKIGLSFLHILTIAELNDTGKTLKQIAQHVRKM